MKKLSSILLICILAITFGCTKDNPNDNGGGNSPTDNTTPTCSITSPQNGTTFSLSENIPVSVVATDPDGTIIEVKLYIDDMEYLTTTTSPYNFTIATGIISSGVHNLKAVAKDNSGAIAESSIVIVIEGEPSGNNIPPTCSITSPHEGDSFTENSQVIVNVVAEDSDGSISVVYLYIDNVGYQELTAFPYNFTIAGGYFSEGSHTLKAVAKDNDGAKAEASVTITISGPGGGTNGVYEVGDYYNRNGIEGVVYRISNGGTHGMIVSMDAGFGSWGPSFTTGATDHYDGLTNTSVIFQNFDLDDYPIFKWCYSKNSEESIEWYIPSITELEDIFREKDIVNSGLLINGGIVFDNSNYWSSTEVEDGYAYFANTPSSSSTRKSYSGKVRAVHSF